MIWREQTKFFRVGSVSPIKTHPTVEVERRKRQMKHADADPDEVAFQCDHLAERRKTSAILQPRFLPVDRFVVLKNLAELPCRIKLNVSLTLNPMTIPAH